MQNLLKSLGIDETYTKPPTPKVKSFNKVKDTTFPVHGYNYMADLLFLPTDKNGFKYLLTMVDLWSNKADFEPIKDKESKTVLDAMLKIFKRGILPQPKATLVTDDGSEFKSVFHKYLYDENIYHKQTLPGRHQQTANVESLNKSLGRIFNGYMNTKETELGRAYREWTDITDVVRTELNKIRKSPPDKNPYTYIPKLPDPTIEAKYNVGDIVYRMLDNPKNALGHNQSGKFRMGDFRYDMTPRKITKVLHYPGNPTIRYMLDTMDNVSFTEAQLIPAKETETEEKFVVKDIIGKKIVKKKIQYLVWWKGYKKEDATYEPKETLIEDGLQNIIDAYETSISKAKK